MMPPDRARRWVALILAIYAALIAVIWIIPRPIDWGLTPWVRGTLGAMRRRGLPGSFDYDFLELATHVALFVPLGILAVVALGRRMAWLAVLGILGMSALVEFGPTMLVSNHSVSSLDLLLNAVGAIVGSAIGYLISTPSAVAGRARMPRRCPGQPPAAHRPPLG